VGLPYDLGGLRELDPPANAGTASPVAPHQYSFDFPERGVFGATAECTQHDSGAASVDILGASVRTRHIVEHCTVPAMRWRFDNEYWVDSQTGFVWRSSQHIHPDSPPVVLEVFRPEQNPV
jgi:hypothetical protein